MSLSLTHHLHSYHLHYNEVNELYISLSLRALAIGIGGLFVPLYLYDNGYSLSLIAMFYLFSACMRMPAELITARTIISFGAKHTLMISYLLLIGFFISIFLIPLYSWMWAVAALVLSFEMAFFWISYHLHISKSRDRHKASTQVGITIILRRLFAAVGPLIGGLIAVSYGVGYNLLIAAALLVLAGYPLFKTPDIRDNLRVNWSKLKPQLLRRDSIAHLGQQFSNLIGVYIWPLWLLLALGQYDRIGLVITTSIVLGVSLTYWVGKLGDKGYNNKLLKIGVGFKSLAHGIRVFSHSFPVALVANTVNDFSDNFVAGPFTEKFYEAADMSDRFTYILRMNMVGVLGKIAFWIVVLSASLLLSEVAAMQSVFIVAAAATPLMLWVSSTSTVLSAKI